MGVPSEFYYVIGIILLLHAFFVRDFFKISIGLILLHIILWVVLGVYYNQNKVHKVK